MGPWPFRNSSPKCVFIVLCERALSRSLRQREAATKASKKFAPRGVEKGEDQMTRLIGKFAIASLVAAAFLFSLGLPSQAQAQAQAHPAHPAGQMQHAQQR